MRRGFFLFTGFSAATFAAIFLLPPAVWPWLGLGALIPAGAFLWRRRRAAALLSLGVAAALCWCGAYRAALFVPAEELGGRRVAVELCVAEFSQGGGVECYLIRPGKPAVRAILYGWEGGAEELRWGDTVAVTADCTLAAYNVWGEETSLYTSKGVFLTLSACSRPVVTRAARVPWWCLPRYWGQRLARSVEAAFPRDVSGFLTALVSGDRSGLDSGMRTRLSRTGVFHLVAVSGVHISFLVGAITLLVGQQHRRRAAVCIPAVALFALMIGTPSAMRACLLQIIALAAPLLRREGDRLTSLAFALAVLLFFNPYSAANIGLQLSFAASLGLIWCTPAVSRSLRRFRLDGTGLAVRGANWALELVSNTFAASLGALVFSLPISLFYFRTLSLVSPLVNLLLLPLGSVLFAAGLAVGAVGLILPGAAKTAAGVLAWPARLALKVVEVGAGVPYAAVTFSDVFYPAFLAAVYALALMGALWKGERRRPAVFAACGGVVLAAAVICTHLTLRAGTLTVGVLEVGQGQSVLLSSQGRTALVDCGGNGATNAGDVAANFLLDRGVDTLDMLILTHLHDDHVNGVETLLRRVAVNQLILPAVDGETDAQREILNLARSGTIPVTWLSENTRLALGESTLTLFAPLGDGGANEEGLSVLASAGEFDVLITGDMNRVVERQLIAQGLPQCEVLVAGHHGSANATGEELLAAIRPRQVVISVGRNSYGHPSEETLARLAARAIPVYRTDRLGTVRVQVSS